MISVYAYHVFGSVLACAKSAHVFQKLSYSLCRLVSNNSSSDIKAFLRFIVFSGSPTAVYHPLHALYGITLWAYLSEPLIKDSHRHTSKFDGKATIPRARTCYGEIYGNIAREENDLVVVT